jgi:hypothetical protein
VSVLITLLGTGKGTWLEVHNILRLQAFEKTIIFIDGWAARDYKNEFSALVVALPEDASTEQLVDIMKQHIKAGVPASDFEVALNISSGTGKQHAALLSAVIGSGYGVRLVTLENNELKVLG